MADVGVGLALSWILEGTSMIDGAERSETVPFYRSTEVRQLRERLLRCIGELPPQEREVIRCHYLQEIPFERIASMQNLTRGRISQVHKQAILRLRQALRDDGGLDMRL
jgi:RNA polymerase sigma factor for flagellar operon FliA